MGVFALNLPAALVMSATTKPVRLSEPANLRKRSMRTGLVTSSRERVTSVGYCSPWVPQHHQSRLHSQPHWVPAVCACTLGLRPSVVSY